LHRYLQMPPNCRSLRRIHLIEALWDTLPEESLPPLSNEWLAEIEKRSTEYDSGSVVKVPWKKSGPMRCVGSDVIVIDVADQLSSGARRDFDASFDWYADRSIVAAERFGNAVDAAMQRIAQDASTMVYVDRMHQECRVKSFPFSHRFSANDERNLDRCDRPCQTAAKLFAQSPIIQKKAISSWGRIPPRAGNVARDSSKLATALGIQPFDPGLRRIASANARPVASRAAGRSAWLAGAARSGALLQSAAECRYGAVNDAC